jgi:raffinose/stachyose/melibiose transport system permease protein
MVDPWGMPEKLMWENYVTVFQKTNLLRYFLNSVIVSVVSVVLLILIAAMAAYALARFSFRIRNSMFYLILLGLGIPLQIALVPLFVINLKLGLNNTLFALIGPNVAFSLPFAIMIIRSYMLTLPNELAEAAFMDGCNRIKMFRLIFFPLSMPAISTVAVFTFVGFWNEFLFALSFITDSKLKTLPIGLYDFIGEFTTNWPLMAAGMVVSTLPMVILYLMMQKRITEAMTVGAIK